MGLLPFERAQKNILIRTLDDGFGGDLMCENLGHSSWVEERGAKHSPLTLEAILKGNNVLDVEHVDI